MPSAGCEEAGSSSPAECIVGLGPAWMDDSCPPVGHGSSSRYMGRGCCYCVVAYHSSSYRPGSTLQNSPPRTQTQRDRPGQQTACAARPLAPSRKYIASAAPEPCSSRSSSSSSPPASHPSFWTRPCSSQTQRPSSKRNLAAGLLALRVSLRFGPQATGCALETDYSGVAHRSSRNLRRVPDSQTAACPPCRAAPRTRRQRQPGNDWLNPAAALPHQLRWGSQV
jgi:hypothetical protein